jgi:predicted Fe-S protein YdhL (DUF1289 family)
MSTPAASPCINVCQMDAATGWCGGCLRSLDEIARWPSLDEIARWSSLDETRRHAVLAALPERRVAWLASGRTLPEPQPPRTRPR